MEKPQLVRFKTQKQLALRLVIATLTGRTIHISQIRPSSLTHTGLATHEISLLRLLEAITNGSHIEISYTGTTLLYKPGLITGSAPGTGATSRGVVTQELPAENTRGISYFLLPLCLLAPFAKERVDVLFTGPGVITSSTEKGDVSADTVRTAILPLYRHFGIQCDIELHITRRSHASPRGHGGGIGGEVHLIFAQQVRLPKTIHLLNPGRVTKIRGVAYCTGVSGSNNARMIDVARGILNPFAQDTYIFSDVSSAPSSSSGKKTGLGFGLSLVAESSTHSLYSADLSSSPDGGSTPEQIGRDCAHQLLEAISHGGCVSSVAAPTVMILMAMGGEDVGRVRLGKKVLGGEGMVRLARDLRACGAGSWGLREANASTAAVKDGQRDGGDEEAVVSVVGRGIGNVGRKIA